MPPTPLSSIVEVIMAAQAVLLAWDKQPASYDEVETCLQALRGALETFRREGEAAVAAVRTAEEKG